MMMMLMIFVSLIGFENDHGDNYHPPPTWNAPIVETDRLSELYEWIAEIDHPWRIVEIDHPPLGPFRHGRTHRHHRDLRPSRHRALHDSMVPGCY
jgi:hypothetical protein